MTNTQIISLVKGEPRITSNVLGEEFGIMHNELLKKIKILAGEIFPHDFNKMFIKSNYKNKQNRTYKNYLINRDGYMFIVMNISTKKAHNKKLQFIEAFNQMEKALLNQQNIEWKKTRELGKSIRLECTDTIQDFIEYAKEQGASKGVKFYYSNLTKAEYKALKLIEYNKPKTRDMLDKMELSQLMIAESIVKKVIIQEMHNKTHYKEIYLLCKIALDNFADTLYLDFKQKQCLNQ